MILEAFAHQEGFFQPNSRSRRNNNPGDLEYCHESISFGALKSDGRFAVFADAATGFHALQRWLSIPAKFTNENPGDGRPIGPNGYLVSGYLGATFKQVVHRFAPPEDNNNVEAYLMNVCKLAHVRPDTVLTAELLR
jgi:hypothetical protein